MKPSEIKQGDLIQLWDNSIGVVVNSNPIPVGTMRAKVCGKYKARVPVVIMNNAIVAVRPKNSNGKWVTVEHVYNNHNVKLKAHEAALSNRRRELEHEKYMTEDPDKLNQINQELNNIDQSLSRIRLELYSNK